MSASASLTICDGLGGVAYRKSFFGNNAVEEEFLVRVINVVVQVVLVVDERQQVVIGHHRVVGGVVEADAVLGSPSRHSRIAGQGTVQVFHHAPV